MDLSGLKPFKQGAEGRLYDTTFLGHRVVVKERFSKKYRWVSSPGDMVVLYHDMGLSLMT